MQCLPLKYVFGWLFRIDSRNVKEEAKEAVLQYQMMCYDLLYDYFAGYADFVETKQQRIEGLTEKRKEAKQNFSMANDHLKAIEARLTEIVKMKYPEYKANNNQLPLFEETEAA